VNYLTPATSASDDGADFQQFTIPATSLVTGTNVLAAEIHQSSGTSSDIVFDLLLEGSLAAGGTASLIAPPTTWRYLDDGSNQGTAWRALAFDDRSWTSGVGEFGYGDGDERTVVSYGPSANPKYTTTYFRHRFTATSVPTALTLTMRIDDGAVAYVNGVEAARFNMPSGPAEYLSRAPLAIADAAERLDRAFTLDPTLVRPGANVIAVEVHQNTLGSSDLSFLASLHGTAAAAPPTTTVAPTTTTTAAPTSTTSTTTTTAAAPPTTVVATTSAAPPPTAAVSLPATATWAYLDDGSDQGAGWIEAAFDDRTWKNGIGEFGYGDGDERTMVGYGPSASRKYPTTYFRTRFESAGVPRDLTLTMRIDDGAIAYLNGIEVARFNMPTSGVDYLTRADVAIYGSAERLDRTFTIDPNLIRVGTNVIAVEVHQDTFGSSDITFLASLAGRS
jgi:hypothetical protein